MRKKVVITALALSLVFSAIFILPPGAGTAGKPLAAGTAYAETAAALPPAAKELADRIKKVHTHVLPADRKTVQDARDRLETHLKTAHISPVWDKISAKITNPADYDQLTPSHVLQFAKQIAIIIFDIEGNVESNIEQLQAYKEFMEQLSDLGGVSGQRITFNDVGLFVNQVQDSLIEKVKQNPAAALGGKSAVAELLFQAIDAVIADSSLKVAVALKNLGITADDIEKVKNNIGNAVDQGQAAPARIALTVGLVRSETTFESTASSNGRTVTPKLSVFGFQIPNILLNWKVEPNNPNVSVTPEGNFVLRSSSRSETVTIKASILDKEIYSGSLTLRATGGGGGGGGGGGISSPIGSGSFTSDVNKAVSDASNKLNELANQIANASGAEKERLIAEAVKLAEEAINQLSTVDVSRTITIADGTAKANWSDSDLIAMFQTISSAAKQLNDRLKQLDAGIADIKPAVTLKFGNIEPASLAVPFSKTVLASAVEQGIGKINVETWGTTVSYDPRGFKEDTVLNIGRLQDAAAREATDKPLASQVFSFEFLVGGKQAEEFTYPVTLQIPLRGQHDNELLVLGKINGKELEIIGGTVQDGYLVVERKHFSSYVVIENKVAFSDLAKVKSWAGRYIDVVAAKGIIHGRGDNRYVPMDQVTHAEFVKMLVIASGLDDGTLRKAAAANAKVWYQPYIETAVNNGIIEENSKSALNPNAAITRAEMAAITANALKATKGFREPANADAVLGKFKDASSIQPALKPGVALSAQEGIIIGVAQGKFDPDGFLTRAQAAVVIYKYINLKQ